MKNNMKIRSIIIGSLAVLSLTGCKSLYGKYERPDVKTAGLFRDSVSLTDTLAVRDTSSFANLPWREVFTDPQLQVLIRKALDNNTNLLNAALNVDIAEAQLKAAKLAFLPQFAFTPQGTITRFNSATTKSYTLPVNASWNVSLFGGLTASKRSAQMALLQIKDYQVSVQTSLVSSVANLYYSLLMLDRQVELVNDMEKLTKDTWDIMQKRFDANVGYRSTSVQAAESNYYSVLTQKADLMRQVREAENSLSLLLTEPAQAIARGKLADQRLPESFSTGVGLQLLRNRADVHANEMALAQCFYAVEKARSNFYPHHHFGNGRLQQRIGHGESGQAAALGSGFAHATHLYERSVDGRPACGQGSVSAGLQHLAEQYLDRRLGGEQRSCALQRFGR